MIFKDFSIVFIKITSINCSNTLQCAGLLWFIY